MATIKPIEGRSVHQIQSGQVIVDLCSVVKELVENSLDAGATNIEVRFKNQGLDSIEVQDNGGGITPQNYETVALKHYTSKLSSYSDLGTLQTFGFRGEALSSLCALSQFTIITCLASDVPKGTRLEFEVSGTLKNTSVLAAQKGTTVIIENLFNNLPVRRRELERNIKREWNRVVALLGQYACIQTGVKLSVTQQQAKGKKTTIFSTKGNASTRENIVNVFGAKTIAALLPLSLKLELDPSVGPSRRRITENDGESKEINISGYMSRPAYGEGRQTPDKQMFFVNSRPCGLPQVAKAFNEVYKSYNISQSPFIFANFEMDTHNYDVNVSPDKRTILLHDQTRMLEHLKESLVALFESQDHTVPVSQLPTQKLPLYKQLTISRENTTITTTSSADSASAEEDDDKSIQHGTNSQDEDTEREEGYVKSPQDLSRDQAAESLISNWVGRNNTRRKGKDDVEPVKAAGPSKEKLRLAVKLAREREQPHNEPAQVEDEAADETSSSVAELETSNLALSVQDNNGQIDERHDQRHPSNKEASQVVGLEDPITAFSSPLRRTDTNVAVVGTTPTRTQRLPETTATITIGDRTVTSSIGTPVAKRVYPGHLASSFTKDASPPSFGTRLSEQFAAPGTTKVDDSSTDDIASDQQSAADSSAEEVESNSLNSPRDVSEDRSSEDEDRGVGVDNPASAQEHDEDVDYINDVEKKAQEDAKVEEMIKSAEEEASRPSEDNVKRANLLLKGGSKKKDATVHLIGKVNTSIARIEDKVRRFSAALERFDQGKNCEDEFYDSLESANPEDTLSLTIHKSDFAMMNIIGQFNLGFILASRNSHSGGLSSNHHNNDDLFIIDQHASDEKYNFERLQATTIVQSQRLVQPKTLDLTALEEEIVKENLPALEANGFLVMIDESGSSPVGQRCQLISLPLSRETTFSLSDLEELISLLSDQPTGSTAPAPRPSRVRKMFAMRACRSSIMIGRTLTRRQMEKVVGHMGELDKPWNCPHGRPTMRHLCGLGAWDEVGWKEGDGRVANHDNGRVETDWTAYIQQMRGET